MKHMRKTKNKVLIIIYATLVGLTLSVNSASANGVHVKSKQGFKHKKTVVYLKQLPIIHHKHIIGIAAVKAANKHALQRPQSSAYINSIMDFTYTPGGLYQVYCAPLSVTDLQFQVGERIVSVAAGDTMRWEVSKTFSGLGDSRVEHLLIKPTESDITNSLVITTTLRTYHLLLRATDHTYMAVITWNYPNSHGFVQNYRDVTDSNQDISAKDFSLKNMDFDYKIYLINGGQPSWLPTTIFNDGHKTYIQFPKTMQEAPTLFLGEKNNIKAINYRVKGNYYIVDAVIQKAQLRLGQSSQVIQIVHGKQL
ncbi:MAG: P-type conjugative transfer protein TrbG [Gammaproteobacteria bacterium]|jgi:type IV secretion system protein VirB9